MNFDQYHDLRERKRLRQILTGVDRPIEGGDRRTEGGFRLPAKACQKRLRACLGCGIKYEGYYPGMCDTCKGVNVDALDEWSLAT